MKRMMEFGGVGLFGVVGAFFLAAGCSPKAKQDRATGQEARKGHDHSQWWCAEHGIPEEECSRCLKPHQVEAMFKSKGDWCEEHNRAKSQCFQCQPELKEVFAAKYRAQFNGKEPPPITDP